MKSFSFFLLLTIVLIALGMSACNVKEKNQRKEIYLKLAIKPLDTYRYTIQQTQDIQSIGNSHATQNLDVEMTYQIIENPDQDPRLKVTFTHILLKSNNSAGQFNYDSDHPERKSLLRSIGNVVGKVYFIDFSKNGSLNNIISPNIMDENDLAELDLAKIINDSTFSNLLENHFDVYPGEAVKLNDKWENETIVNLFNYDIIKNNTYILKKIENGIATISSKAELSIPENMANQSKYKFQIQFDGQQNGIVKIDIESGIILSYQSKLKLNGTVYSRGQNIPLNITADTKGTSELMK